LPPLSETAEGLPPYRRIATLIRREIDEGRYRPGDRIATVDEIGEHFHVAPMTARNAMKLLRAEGLVTSVQGKGTFVADRQTSASTAEAPRCDGCADTTQLLGAIRQLTETLGRVEAQLQQSASHHAA
jgi:GntR family transcriptional regulator